MALDELVESLKTTSSVLGEAGKDEWIGELDERRSAIEKAAAKGDVKTVGRLVSEIKGFFGGMGSLNDFVAEYVRGPIRGREGEAAYLYLEDQLDDLFYNCLTWRTEGQEASSRYQLMMRSFIGVLKSVDRDFERKHHDWLEAHPGEPSAANQMRPRHYYHFNPQWFRKWSD